MTEKPILFKPEMVMAILEGLTTQESLFVQKFKSLLQQNRPGAVILELFSERPLRAH